MKIKHKKNGTILVEMTHEELGIIRYTLNIGAEKLISSAIFQKSMKSPTYASAQETADEASAANDELERATQEWVRNPKV